MDKQVKEAFEEIVDRLERDGYFDIEVNDHNVKVKVNGVWLRISVDLEEVKGEE